MPRYRLILGAAVGVCAALLAGRALSQSLEVEKAEKKAQELQAPEMKMPSPAEMAEMMKKYQAVAAPGPHHKKLEPFVGSWNTTMRIFMGGPTAPPTESKGASEVKWVLDGRFLMEELSGEMKMPGPDGKEMTMPFKGLGLTGYDNYKNMYVGTWADNQNTFILSTIGNADPTGKVFTFYGQMDEAMLDVHGRMVKYVSRIIDDKKHVFEIYDLHAGPDYKVVEITYERK